MDRKKKKWKEIHGTRDEINRNERQGEEGRNKNKEIKKRRESERYKTRS